MTVHLSAEGSPARAARVVGAGAPRVFRLSTDGAAWCDGDDEWEDEEPGEDDEDDEDEDEEAGWGDEPPDGPGWSVVPPLAGTSR